MPTALAHPVHPLAHRVRGENGICALTGWSPAFAYTLINTGQLPSVRVGRSVTVLHADLVAFLESHRGGGSNDSAA